ncbi:hypothetical protein DPMN_133630 [Dreissena polymorpha]|uniref:Uncharacterized protein n=1 Tax=Dreissena polymorpha TaxID=45954 RepID=A0A9D4FUM5_DREPO|nr:hypothetical protein DPMN_133630 [Dreissena polymorpha]
MLYTVYSVADISCWWTLRVSTCSPTTVDWPAPQSTLVSEQTFSMHRRSPSAMTQSPSGIKQMKKVIQEISLLYRH